MYILMHRSAGMPFDDVPLFSRVDHLSRWFKARRPPLRAWGWVAVLVLGALLSRPLTLGAVPGSCTLAWDAPTTYTDGAALTLPVQRYHLYRAATSGAHDFSQSYRRVQGHRTHVRDVECIGIWYWVVTAVVDGIESAPSNELLTRQSGSPAGLRADP
jgi:hypothetical protein